MLYSFRFISFFSVCLSFAFVGMIVFSQRFLFIFFHFFHFYFSSPVNAANEIDSHMTVALKMASKTKMKILNSQMGVRLFWSS